MTEDVVVVIIVFFAVIIFAISIFDPEDNKDKKDKEDKKNKESEKDGMKNYDFIDYLGGHPIEVDGMKKGELLINQKEIKFVKEFSFITGVTFKIDIDDILDCSLETKKSISAKRMMLVGLLAFALKKGKKYVRVKFEHKLGESEVVFHSTKGKNSTIVKKINEIRMKNK